MKLVIRLGKVLLTDHYTVKKYCFVYLKQTIYYNISPKLNGRSFFEQITLKSYSCSRTFKEVTFISTIILIKLMCVKQYLTSQTEKRLYSTSDSATHMINKRYSYNDPDFLGVPWLYLYSQLVQYITGVGTKVLQKHWQFFFTPTANFKISE